MWKTAPVGFSSFTMGTGCLCVIVVWLARQLYVYNSVPLIYLAMFLVLIYWWNYLDFVGSLHCLISYCKEPYWKFDGCKSGFLYNVSFPFLKSGFICTLILIVFSPFALCYFPFRLWWLLWNRVHLFLF